MSRCLPVFALVLLLAACGGASTAAPPSSVSPSPSSAAKPAATTPGSAAAGAITVKSGTQHVATDAPLYIAMEKGFFKEQGLNVQFEDVNGEEAISALAAGQLDTSVGAIYSGLFNAIGRGIDIRLVATKGSITEKPQDKPAAGLVLRKQLYDSGAVKDLKDLKGKKIAVAGRGATQEESLDNGLRTVGLTIDDIDVKTMPFPDTLPALANGRIDGAMELQPWITQGKANGILVFWKDMAEFSPGLQTNALTFGSSILKMGKDAGNRFIVAYTQGLRYYNDAVGPKHANWDEFVSIMVKNTSLKDRNLYDQVGWTYMSPNCSLNAPSVVQNQDWYMAHGYVKQAVDLKVAIDDSYCQSAVQQLGPYK
jgi:ABC-type nitrate/sulfonate/bicarbonate transport system substrate-binding protein